MRITWSAVFIVAMAALVRAADSIPATGGDIVITPIMHASVQIEHAGMVIQVDPYSKGDLSQAAQADLVLVTDIHGDHMDPPAIATVRKPGAQVVMPAAVRDAAGDAIPGPMTIIANGETKTVSGVSIEAIPMYNLPAPGQDPSEVRHTKGRGNGYVVTIGGKRLYFAGDTQCTPEMRALENIDAAFLPMNPPNTMLPSEAAECARAFEPTIAYPFHYRGQKPEDFAAALKGSPVEVRILSGWYPAGTPDAR